MRISKNHTHETTNEVSVGYYEEPLKIAKELVALLVEVDASTQAIQVVDVIKGINALNESFKNKKKLYHDQQAQNEQKALLKQWDKKRLEESSRVSHALSQCTLKICQIQKDLDLIRREMEKASSILQSI